MEDFKRALVYNLMKPTIEVEKYIQLKKGYIKSVNSFDEIVESFEEIIRKDNLFDPTNKTIVLCDHYLQSVLNVPNFHVSQLRDLILAKMTTVYKGQTSATCITTKMGTNSYGSVPVTHVITIERQRKCFDQAKSASTAHFSMPADLLEAFQTLENVDKNKTAFTYMVINNCLYL